MLGLIGMTLYVVVLTVAYTVKYEYSTYCNRFLVIHNIYEWLLALSKMFSTLFDWHNASTLASHDDDVFGLYAKLRAP